MAPKAKLFDLVNLIRGLTKDIKLVFDTLQLLQ
jgi:hypothetical protein